MLVLTRKIGEEILVGDNIQLKVIAVDGDQVKIGIEAPKAMKIYRKELYEAIQQQNTEALHAQNIDLLKEWK